MPGHTSCTHVATLNLTRACCPCLQAGQQRAKEEGRRRSIFLRLPFMITGATNKCDNILCHTVQVSPALHLTCLLPNLPTTNTPVYCIVCIFTQAGQAGSLHSIVQYTTIYGCYTHKILRTLTLLTQLAAMLINIFLLVY